MLNTANHLRETIDRLLPALEAITDEEAGISPAPGKWSKKETLGHLIDSACNNQQKFVRAMTGSGIDFVSYRQDLWVGSQKYNEATWKDLIALWRAYNIHIAHYRECGAQQPGQYDLYRRRGYVYAPVHNGRLCRASEAPPSSDPAGSRPNH